jgi:hypothetical protein
MAAEAVGILRAAASALDGAGTSVVNRIADDLAALSAGADLPTARFEPALSHGQVLRSALLPLEKMAEAFSDIAIEQDAPSGACTVDFEEASPASVMPAPGRGPHQF